MSATVVARILLAAATVLIAGCTSVVRVAYNNGDIAARLMANDYFDLEGEQVELFNGRLARLHAWHRREELPRYAQALDSAAARVRRGATRADVEWAVAMVRERYRVLASQAIDESIPVLATLQPANYAALEKKLAAGNRRLTRELLEGTPAAREAARIDAISERIEEWLGSVSAAHRALIENHVRAYPVDATLRLENRRARQREFMRALRQERNSPALRDSLQALFVDYDAQRRVEYARAWQAWQERAITLISQVLAAASTAQREYAAARLNRYADDFRALAEDGRTQPGSDTRAAQEAAQPGT